MKMIKKKITKKMKKIKSFKLFEATVQDENVGSAIAEIDIFIDEINILKEKFNTTTYISNDFELEECIDNLMYRAEDLKDELEENNIEL